jgi:hypothetical protein
VAAHWRRGWRRRVQAHCPLPNPSPKKPAALKKRQREKLEEELDSGPQVDRRRDDIMRNMLSMKPKLHAEMKFGRRRSGE